MPPPDQTLRRRALCEIWVADRDVTDIWDPHLISVTIRDKTWGNDEANIELDDRDASLDIPAYDAPIKIYLGWANEGPRIPPVPPPPATTEGVKKELPWYGGNMILVFTGIIQSLESGFSRTAGGRRIWIEATGGDLKEPPKQKENSSYGEGYPDDESGVDNGTMMSLGEAFKKEAAKHGLGAVVSPVLENIQNDFWFLSNESFYSWADRQGLRHGANFKVAGKTAYLTDATNRLNATGQQMPTIEAWWGINLIAWRIKPYAAKASYGHSQSVYFDQVNSVWRELTSAIPGLGSGAAAPFNATAKLRLPTPAPNLQTGAILNRGSRIDSFTQRGKGWCLINGEPMARAGGSCNIYGARPGVDGFYRIETAEHNYTRNGGYTTKLDVDQRDDVAPKVGAGQGYGGFQNEPEQQAQQQAQQQPDQPQQQEQREMTADELVTGVGGVPNY